VKKFSAVFFVIAAMAAAAQAQTPQTMQLPPGAGRDLINERCVSCHPVSTITAQRKDAMGWAVTLQQMADRGAEVSPEEMATIIEYLARTLPAQSDGRRARAGAGNARQGG
jgi:mono/diheme cytochrome c family protein